MYGGHLHGCEKILVFQSPGGRVRRSASRTRACLKIAFCKMCVTVCGKFVPKSGGVAGLPFFFYQNLCPRTHLRKFLPGSIFSVFLPLKREVPEIQGSGVFLRREGQTTAGITHALPVPAHCRRPPVHPQSPPYRWSCAAFSFSSAFYRSDG